MNKFLYLLIVVFCMGANTFAQSKTIMNTKETNQNILIAFFSATGTTAHVAHMIAAIADAEVYEITPAQLYSDDDLDWRNEKSRSSLEMNNLKARPALGGKKLDVSAFDVIFIGYPIWWNLAPRIIQTFIESHEWKGRKLVPFATSGSSSIDNSIEHLKICYPELNWANGKLLNRIDNGTLREWINDACH